MRAWVWGVALCTSACSDGAFWAWPELPAQTQSIIMATERASRFEIEAAEWSSDVPPVLELSSLDLSRVTLLPHAETLDELGYQVGPVALADQGDCREQRLVPADAIFERGSTDDDWTQTTEASDKVVAARALARCPCQVLEAIRSFEPGLRISSRPQVVLVEDELYVLSHFGSMRINVTETSTGTILDPNPLETNPDRVVAAPEGHWLAPDGSIWIASGVSAARLVRWDPNTESRATVILDEGPRCYGVSGATAGAPPEVYAACVGGVTQRYDGESWSQLSEPGHAEDSNQAARVAWLGPGQAVTALHDSNLLGFIRQGRLASVTIRGEVSSIETWLASDAFGVLAGTRLGEVAQLDQESLRPLPRLRGDPQTSGPIYQMWEQGGGLLYVTKDGFFGQVLPGPIVCIPIPAIGYIAVYGGAGRDDIVWLAGANNLGDLVITEYRLVDAP